jgi:hypothetical protein
MHDVLMPGRYERGQTLPFWVMSVIVALALTFFIANYANTVRYQIKAQNAADSAAAAALGQDAAALNSVQTLLGAVDIQELKVQDATAALPYVLGTTPCGASNLLTTTCTSALQGAATDIATANQNLQSVLTTISNFEAGTGGSLTGTLSNPQSTISTLFAPNGSNGCSVAILTDCDFKYTTVMSYNSSTGFPTVDEYACKVVTNSAASFLHLPSKTFYAIGHTTSTLGPLSSAYSTSTLGPAFAATGAVYPDVSGSNILTNLSALNINTAFYAAVAAPPPSAPQALTTVCPAS